MVNKKAELGGKRVNKIAKKKVKIKLIRKKKYRRAEKPVSKKKSFM